MPNTPRHSPGFSSNPEQYNQFIPPNEWMNKTLGNVNQPRYMNPVNLYMQQFTKNFGANPWAMQTNRYSFGMQNNMPYMQGQGGMYGPANFYNASSFGRFNYLNYGRNATSYYGMGGYGNGYPQRYNAWMPGGSYYGGSDYYGGGFDDGYQYYEQDDYAHYGRAGRAALGQHNPQYAEETGDLQYWTPERAAQFNAEQQALYQQYTASNTPAAQPGNTPAIQPGNTPAAQPSETPLPSPSPELVRSITPVPVTDAARKFAQTRERWVRNSAPNLYAARLRLYWSGLQTRLNRYTDGASGRGITFKKYGGTDKLKMFGFEKGGEKWYVRQSIMWSSARNRPILTLVKDGDPLAQMNVMRDDIFKAGTTIDFAKVDATIARAKERRLSEQADASGIGSFDLPRDRRVGYIGLYDVDDPTEEQQLRHFPGMMNANGYNFVSQSGETALGVRSNPIEMIRDNMLAMHQAGVRDFYISLSVHGDEENVYFHDPSGGMFTMTPEDLNGLLTHSQFRDSKIFLSLNACHGGGFNTARYQTDAPGRIRVVTQVKPEITNPIRTTGSRGDTNYSSPYDYYLWHYLFEEHLPYGQAHVRADQEVKRNFPGLDAGAFSSNRTGGVETARLPGESPDEPPSLLDSLDGGGLGSNPIMSA